MATEQQNDKSPKRSPKKGVLPASDRALRKKKEEEEEHDPSNYMMSLNVLAQVASATLEKEPPKQKSKTPTRKTTKRSIHSLELLDLEQIKMLSEKLLVSYFAELSSNEMTRNFTFTCYLMPKVCKEQFKSFGNETQARLKMKKHLLKHLEQLEMDKNDPSKEGDFKFTAEPLHVRDKKRQEMSTNPRKKCRDGTGTFPVYQVTSKPGPTKFTGIKPVLPAQIAENVREKENTDVHYLTIAEVQDSTEYDNRKDELRELDANRHLSIRRNTSQKKTAQVISGNNRSESRKPGSEGKEPTRRDPTEQRIAENEQFIIDLLSRNQPHHDHSYTTMFGKKKGIEGIEFETENDIEPEFPEDTGEEFAIIHGKRWIKQHKLAEPILCLGNVSVMDELSSSGPSTDEASKTIIVCAEEIIDEYPDDVIDLVDGIEPSTDTPGIKPYPPMPKYPLARRGRIMDPIITPDDIEWEEFRQHKKMAGDDWERKAALKCIRELKLKKKEDKKPLYCRLCKDKTFTATATLMYHYRSHAGIKPFVCLICNTTFTRQHSLNYHMLIHNNQSRFTCKDCGRKFRHPSHFKEHLRRHTGETPFICTDCPQRFKTRNTYKRHLKTRHGKLLTAAGIHILSVEEFAKIRTKPYRRTPDRPNRKLKSKYTGIDSADLPLPGKKLHERSGDDGGTDSEGGDSSTISVTGDLGELVDIKLEIDNALQLEEAVRNHEMIESRKLVATQQTIQGFLPDQKTILTDLGTLQGSVLQSLQSAGEGDKLYVPLGVNLPVNS